MGRYSAGWRGGGILGVPAGGAASALRSSGMRLSVVQNRALISAVLFEQT